MNRRLTVVFVCLMGFFTLVAARLVQLQIVEADQWRELAKRFQEGTVTIPALRGRIYDRNGVLLAEDVRAVSVAVDNYNMTRPDLLEGLLVTHLKIPRATAQEKLYRPSYFTWIARAIFPEQAEALERAARQAGARGLIFLEDRTRQYPHGDLASNVIGFAGIDGHGLEGIELFFDQELQGTESVWSFVRMADGTQIERRQVQAGRPGRDLTLTIDSRIQHIAEQAITHGVRRYKAKAGIALVLDPWTGEVLAMAQDKRYDLNKFQSSRPEQRQNLAVVSSFEPGSSFKVFPMLAALEHNVIALDERISGSAAYRIAQHTFRNADGKEYGMVTPKDVIKNSINTAMIRIAQRLGEERLYEALKKYGFGQKTGIELPGEVSGYLPPVRAWSALEIGSIAIGQSVSVTAIQLASRVAMIANGGKAVRPRIVASPPADLPSWPPSQAPSPSEGRGDGGEGKRLSDLRQDERIRAYTSDLSSLEGIAIPVERHRQAPRLTHQRERFDIGDAVADVDRLRKRDPCALGDFVQSAGFLRAADRLHLAQDAPDLHLTQTLPKDMIENL